MRRSLPPAIALSPLLALWVAVGAWRGAVAAPTGDEPPFLRYAHNLLHGVYATPGSMDATQFLWHGPGLPALLAPLVALGTPLWALRLTGPLLLFAAIVLFERLLAMTLPRRWALGGAWALGLYAPFGELVGPLHKEPLALVLLVAAASGTSAYLRQGRRRQLALAGLTLAGLVMTRLEYGWVVLALLLAAAAWAARARSVAAGRALAVCALAFGGCLPWLTYTWSLTHRLLYWGNAGGLSLYWMAPHAGQLGAWHGVHTVFLDPTLAAYRPFFAHVSALTPLRRDLALQHAALADITAHPAGYALDLLANVGRMLVAAPFSVGLAPRLVGGYTLFTLALLGALAWALTRAWPHRRRLPRTAAPFAAFALGGFLVHLAPSAEPRLVMPLVPLLVWLTLHAAAVTRGQEIVRPAAAGSGHDLPQASSAGAARGGRLDLRLRQRRQILDGPLRAGSAERGRDVGRDR